MTANKNRIFTYLLLLLLLSGCSSKLDPSSSTLDSFILVGHRGASAFAPEHTIASYELSKKLGVDYIEIDIQMTKDGTLVAMHDDTVDRTTNGSGPVKSYLLKDLKKLNASKGFNETNPNNKDAAHAFLSVPTLEEIFNHFGQDINYYIEIKSSKKYPKMEEELVKLLRKHQLLGKNNGMPQTIIQSFSNNSLKKIHKLEPSIPLIQLLSYREPAKITEKDIKHWKKYATGIAPNYEMIDEAFINKAKKNGLLVHPYTVNSKEEFEQLLDWGITGVFTDYTSLLSELLKERIE